MKIALNIPEQLMKRLAIQMERNGQTAAEIIRQAMVESFDRKDSWYSPAHPLEMMESTGSEQSRTVKALPPYVYPEMKR
jgi:hypothetical protein